MKGIPDLKKGDDVMVKFPTDDGYIRHSAVVTRNGPDKLVVIFASGFRYEVPHGEGRYERILSS